MVQRWDIPYVAALKLSRPGSDRHRAGLLLERGDHRALDYNQDLWRRAFHFLHHRELPPWDGRKTGPRANALHRRTRRLAQNWCNDPRVDPKVRDAASWGVRTLAEMDNSLHGAVYVFSSSRYPDVLKIGSAEAGVRLRVWQQVEGGETVTILRTYKSLQEVRKAERALHVELDLFRVRRGTRTECFTVSLEAVDDVAEKLGFYIHPQPDIEVSR